MCAHCSLLTAHPFANFLKDGCRMACCEMTQWRPVRMLATSPLMTQSSITMFFPFKMIFCAPDRIDCLHTLFPDACTPTNSHKVKLCN